MTLGYLVALGGNLLFRQKTPPETMQSAVDSLRAALGPVRACSQTYRTPAFPLGSGPDFANAAALVESDLTPEAVLGTLHEIETAHGRRRTGRWGPRTLDLDLIAAGDLIRPDAVEWGRWRALPPDRQLVEQPTNLILPHPRLQDRAFVLVPLMEVAPAWRHPLLNLTVREMHDNLTEEDRRSVVPWEDPGCQ